MGCHSSAVSFYYLWYGAIYKRQYILPTNTNVEQMYVYASERSERALKILAFLHTQTAISFNILSVH